LSHWRSERSFACRKFVAHPLHKLAVGTGLDAVVQRLERHATLGQLPLEILVAVDAELGIVRKVGAELQEERPKSSSTQ
jgi:hypothetical protein